MRKPSPVSNFLKKIRAPGIRASLATLCFQTQQAKGGGETLHCPRGAVCLPFRALYPNVRYLHSSSKPFNILHVTGTGNGWWFVLQQLWGG